MALINRPMYEQFGARHLGVKGPGAMTTLEEGVMGVIPLDIMSDPSYWFIQGIRVFGARKYVAAGGAGTYSKIGLGIEDTSAEYFIKVLRWDINIGDQLIFYRVERTSISLDPSTYGYGWDTRIPEGQHSRAVVVSATTAANPGTIIGDFRPDRQPFLTTNQVPMIISPGQVIYNRDDNANTQALQTIVWAEIPAYKAEI
jgi:hypothetical protein